jgi:hypothetical protein
MLYKMLKVLNIFALAAVSHRVEATQMLRSIDWSDFQQVKSHFEKLEKHEGKCKTAVETVCLILRASRQSIRTNHLQKQLEILDRVATSLDKVVRSDPDPDMHWKTFYLPQCVRITVRDEQIRREADAIVRQAEVHDDAGQSITVYTELLETTELAIKNIFIPPRGGVNVSTTAKNPFLKALQSLADILRQKKSKLSSTSSTEKRTASNSGGAQGLPAKKQRLGKRVEEAPFPSPN